MYRKLALAVTALLAVSGCGSADDAERDFVTPTRTTPAPLAAFWSTPATTEQQQTALAHATRAVDVCALAPRHILDTLAAVRSVRTDSLYSCRATLGPDKPDESTTLTWSAMLLPAMTRHEWGRIVRVGDVDVQVVPDRPGGTPRACGLTARFASGAAYYLGVTTPAAADPCATGEKLVPGMLDQWRAAPPQGTSADTARTVVLGADPCAVRAKLGPTVLSRTRPQLAGCDFSYRGQNITVSYEYRLSESLSAGGHEISLSGRPVLKSRSVRDPRIPIYDARLGPDLPAQSTEFGSRAPIAEVAAASEPVAEEVMTQVLTLFPPN